MLHRIVKSAFAARLASRAVHAYIRSVAATTAWRLDGREHFETLEAREGGFILAFWHARLLMAPTVRRLTPRRVHMLISSHRDGDIIADAVAPFGVEFIRGSAANARKTFKNKSGAPALMQMLAALERGDVVGVTPDGPRGPRETAQAGVARLALMSGAPILPAAYATSRGRRLGTWDGFWLPCPFSRGVYRVGAPIEAEGEVAALTAKVTESLNAVTAEAVAAVRGRSPERAKME